jgi:copper chaperone CopZ
MLLAAGVAFAAPPRTVTLVVENMTCGTCPIVVKKALERVSGVSSTSVDFDKKTATVTSIPTRLLLRSSLRRRQKQAFPRNSSPRREHRYPGVRADPSCGREQKLYRQILHAKIIRELAQ